LLSSELLDQLPRLTDLRRELERGSIVRLLKPPLITRANFKSFLDSSTHIVGA
jgi:hypothetical protein